MDVMQLRRNLLLNVSHGGGNLIDISCTPVYYISGGGVAANNFTVSDGVITTSGNAQAGWLCPCNEGETYTFTLDTSYAGGTRLAMRAYYSDTSLTNITSGTAFDNEYVQSTSGTMTFTVPTGTNYVYVGFYADARIAGTTISNLVLTKN